MALHCYKVWGWRVESSMLVPDLLEQDAFEGPADVTIRRGSVPAALTRPVWQRGIWQVGRDEILLTVSGVARLLIRGGHEVIVDAESGIEEHSLRFLIFGPACAALLQRRGFIPLHASSVVARSGCVSFLGDSGTGKSTVTAFLCDRGYRVVSDDVCVVSVPETGAPVAWPGLTRLRVHKDVLDALGEPIRREVFPDSRQKYRLSLAGRFQREPVRLSRLYFLESGSETVPVIRRFTDAEVLPALVENTYCSELLQATGNLFAHLTACLAIGRTTPMFRVALRRGLAELNGHLDVLIAHMEAHDV